MASPSFSKFIRPEEARRRGRTSERDLDILETILRYRFGLDGGKPKTLEEVGKKFGVTRERIRQLQNIALSKLRRALAKKERPIDIDLEMPVEA